MKKYFYLVPYIVLIFVALPSCTKDTDTFDKDIDENPAEGENQTGRVVFWTSQSSGWSNIDVTDDGVYAGSMNKYFNSAPPCGSDGGITITKAPGTYPFTAKSNTGCNWNGSITITAGGCSASRLDFSQGGGGGTQTNIVFWTKTTRYGQIQIYVNNTYRGTITYSYTGAPNCGASGCVTAAVTGTGNTWYAKAGNYTWNSSELKLTSSCTSVELQ